MKIVPLGDVATIERHGVDPGKLPPLTTYLGLEHIERGGRILGRGTIAGAQLASTKFRFTADHILFGKLRPNLGKVSRPNFDGVCSTDILPIRPSNCIDRDYLAHYLSQPAMVEFAASRAAGANLPRLSPAVLAAFPVPLPPLYEQRRIAAILDHADELRSKSRQLLAHLDDLAEVIFHDMFSNRGSVALVDDLAIAIRTGPFGSQLLHSEFVDQGIAVLGLDNVVGNDFKWAGRRYITREKYLILKRYTVRPGDVLISIMGTTGRCVVVPDDIPTAINTKHICAITLDASQARPEFVRAAFLWSPVARDHLRRQTKGSIMAGLNMGIIKSMPIPIPPMALQLQFEERLGRLEVARNGALAAQARYDELFASLQSRAFQGEL